MSEQITSAMLDELEQHNNNNGPFVSMRMTHTPVPRETLTALIAAARRAERYETALRSIYDEVRFAAKADPIAHELRETVEWVRDTIHATVWGSSPPAALTPEPPQRPQERAHSPEAGGSM